jgi:hypothetical protein
VDTAGAIVLLVARDWPPLVESAGAVVVAGVAAAVNGGPGVVGAFLPSPPGSRSMRSQKWRLER